MAGAILAGERLGWRLGKVEGVVGNVCAQGIEAGRPEGGDRWWGWRSALLGSLMLELEEEGRELSVRETY